MTDTLPIGTTLRSSERVYTIRRVLGKGGFGITYLATAPVTVGNITTKADFAIKEHYISSMNHREGTTVRVSNANNRQEVADSLDNFLTEAQRLNSLSLKHPNIVRVNENFRANDTAYYVMEYVEGQSLRDYVRAKPGHQFPHPDYDDELLHIITAVGEAVAFLHDNRITHLDIKPDNIIMRDGTTPVLIDFGLSKHYDKGGRPTSTVRMTGCSDGFSPMEQYLGITAFTPEADIYALAATALYCLTGKVPAKAGDLDIQAVCESLQDTAQPMMLQGIENAMAKLKEHRTHDVREFLRQIDYSTHIRPVVIPSPKEKPKEPTDKTKPIKKKKKQPQPQPKPVITGPRPTPPTPSLWQRLSQWLRRRWMAVAAVAVLFIAGIAVAALLSKPKASIEDSVVQNMSMSITTPDGSTVDFVYTGQVHDVRQADGSVLGNVPFGRGKGVYTLSNGRTATYEGIYSDGLRNDINGKLTYSNGDYYTGNFTHDRMEGEGTFYSAEGGLTFIGTFWNGEPYNGQWTSPEGDTYQVKDGRDV